MGMATSDDLLLQSMQELRELHQEVLAANARVDAQLDVVAGNLVQVRQALGEFQQELGVFKQELGAVTQHVDELKRDVDALKQDVDALKQNVDALKQDMDALKQDMTSLGQRMDATDLRVNSIGQTVHLLGEGLTGLTQVFRSTKTTHEGFFEKMGRTLNTLIEQQHQDRTQLGNHERRLCLLEQA